MIFGEHVRAADADEAVRAGESLASACTGEFGTVGGLVPVGFQSYVRLFAPDSELDDWWGAYRLLLETVAGVAARHTDTPHDAHLAVWHGYGFGRGTTLTVWQEPDDLVAREALQAERDRLRQEDARRAVETASALDRLPLLRRPGRDYFLLAGTVASMHLLTEPGEPGRWQRPDLVWPADRRWFVGSDVDFWSLYVGGSAAFVGDLAAAVETPTRVVDPSTRLEIED